MIVQWIKAKNFMRFADLHITNIPPSGSMAIVGENETGKSAIGEAVTFALFGETPRAREETLFRVVRWGENETEVSLGFTIPSMGSYVIERSLDRDGLATARLIASETGDVLAEGNRAVQTEVWNLLGFQGDEFRYSFYLAQNELDIVDGGSGSGARDVIFKMLGIDILEKVQGQAQNEYLEMNAELRQTEQDLALASGLLENFEYDPSETERLNRTVADLQSDQDKVQSSADQIKDEIRRYEESLETYERTFEQFETLGNEIKTLVIREKLNTTVDAAGSLHKGLREMQEAGELSLDQSTREASSCRERENDLREFKGGLTSLRTLVGLQKERRQSDLSDEVGSGGATLKTVHRTQEEELSKLRRSFLLSIVEVVIACGVAVMFFVALHSVSSGGNYVDFLKGVLSDATRESLALGGGVVFGLFAAVFVLKAVLQRKSIVRRATALERVSASLRTAQVEASALSRIDFEDVGTLKDAQAQIAEPEIRESIRLLMDRFNEFIEGRIHPVAELERAEQDRASAENELRKLETKLNQRQALIDFMARRIDTVTEGIEGIHARWASAAPRSAISSLDELEIKVYTLFDSLADLRNAWLAHGDSTVVFEGLNLQRRWADVKGELDGLGDLLTETMGHQGRLNGARFESFIERRDWDHSRQFLGQFSEETARIRSAFPSLDALRKKLRKLRDDLERAEGRLLGLASRMEVTQRELDRLAPRRQRYEDLVTRQQHLDETVLPLRHNIDIRRTLVELLEGAIDNIKNRLGPEMGKFIGATISRITRNRYGNASVSEDMEIRIFSREKNGFISLDEVSGGTRDQVLLCLRLALSQALVRARMGIDRGQFLFLDEPVSSFDEHRSQAFLDLVRHFSPNFQQVFVTLHIVGTAPQSYERIIRTDLESTTLKQSLK